jgi:membrane-bound lytic murein transglycosylase D
VLKALLYVSIFAIGGCSNITTVSDSSAMNTSPSPSTQVVDQNTTISEQALNNETTPADKDLWDRLRKGYSLNLDIDKPRFTQELNWYARHPGYIKRVSLRAQRYLHYIVEQTESYGVPAELALLPIVESAFDPFAYSHGSASGIWQFIPGTGKMYGLQQDWWHDGRRDITASTQAAMKFLSGLNREFKGNWLHALAAYNSGAGTVRKAIRYNKKRGLPTDFWSLKLPKETRAYAPKLLAIAKIMQNPEKFCITLPSIPDEPYFSIVDIKGQLDLSQAAQLAEIDIDAIYELNPSYSQWATHPNGPHKLLVPVEQTSIFTANLAKLPADQRIRWQRHTIKSGESLISIAKKYQTTTSVLKDVNPIKGSAIRAGKTLLIPTAVKQLGHYRLSADQRINKKQSRYRGKNGLQKITHKVSSGDSFWELANKHKVKVRDIARWNGMAPKDSLKVGQKLIIWAKSSKINSRRNVIRNVKYSVRKGDSLYRIADKFNVKVSDIKKWNNILASQYLKPGQRLTLKVNVTAG